MTARIARGGPSRGSRPAARSTATHKRRGKSKKQGLFEGLPISPDAARKLAMLAGIGAVLIIVVAGAIAFRLPQQAGTAIGEQIGSAGFAVTRVELRGLSRIDPATVTKEVLKQPSLAMPLVDLDAIRARMLEYAWVKEARVSRRLPDTLVVDVIERSPAAVWQHNRQLQLVDAEGVALQPVRPDALPNLPLVIGPGAQHRIAALGTLVDGAPQVRPVLAGATWIGGRRWDLRFKTGETLSLPEGEGPSLAALKRFVDMNQRRRLLGGNFLRFDMRIEGKMIVQLRQTPDAQVPAITPGAPAAPGQRGQDLSRTI